LNGSNCLGGEENTLREKRFPIRHREQTLMEKQKDYLKREEANRDRLFPHGHWNKSNGG
jgi:hypothetical protein